MRLAGIGLAARAARARGPCSWVPRGSVSCTAVRTLSWVPWIASSCLALRSYRAAWGTVRAMSLAWALARPSARSFPALSPREMRSELSSSWEGTQRTKVLRVPWAFSASLYLAHRSACLEVGLTLLPFPIRSASSTTPLQSETIQVPSKHFQGYEDSVELGSVCSLDRAGQGPGC